MIAGREILNLIEITYRSVGMWVDLEIPMIRDLKYPFLYSFLPKKAVPIIEFNVFSKWIWINGGMKQIAG